MAYLCTKTKVFQKTEVYLGCQIGSLDSSCTSVESKDLDVFEEELSHCAVSVVL